MCNILVIEDDLDCADVLARMFRGHDVRVAHSEAEARAALASMRSGVLLVDLNLPDGRGDAIVRSLRDQSAAFVSIMLTGEETDPEQEADLLEQGALYVEHKPFNHRVLSAKVRNAENQLRARLMLSEASQIQEQSLDKLRGALDQMRKKRGALQNVTD